MYHNDEFDQILMFLQRGKWFAALDTDMQEEILRHARTRNFSAGEALFHQEQDPTGLFVTLDGQISLTRIVDSGDEFLYLVCGPGFWFGEFASFCNTKTVVTATARVATRVMYLPRTVLRRLTADSLKHYRAFAELALQRYDVLARSAANMAHLSPEENLRTRLIDMCSLTKETGVNCSTHGLNLTQSEVASMIGVSRQTANQLLKKLAADNVVKVSFRNVRVLETATMSAAH